MLHYMSKVRAKSWVVGVLWITAVIRIYGFINISPPGLAHDEVANWLIDRSILAGNHAIYFTRAYGHEAGFHYVQAIFVALLGDNLLALRLPTAFAGLLGVAVSYALVRKMFNKDVALISTILLAVLFFPVFYSRLALRAIFLPLFSSLSAYFWWQALPHSPQPSVATPRSLKVGLIAASLGTLTGIILGFASGFIGGWLDSFIRIISDAWMTIPGLTVLIVIASYVEEFDINSMAIVIAMFAWPGPTRIIRAQVLSMRERGYVQMAQISGASTFAIMFKEIMPNLLPYLAATFTGAVSSSILAATGLEILGLGPTRIPTLGMTISNALRASAILRGMWWWWGFPIVMLITIFIALFLMTIGLDEISNPRLRGIQQ